VIEGAFHFFETMMLDDESTLARETRRWIAKEPFNAYSHLFGVALAIPGLLALIIKAGDDAFKLTALSIYGGSLILLYLASSMFHGLDISERWNDRLRRFDHMAIFVLIAGSYTPICLIKMQGWWGWSIFAVVWAVAAAGIAMKIFFEHLPPLATSLIYLGMGWFGVIAFAPLAQAVPFDGLIWLIIGGLIYTAGGIIYAIERPDPYPNVFGHHEIFHIFILGGSVSHFVFMAGWVA
jgi:hemolysin III